MKNTRYIHIFILLLSVITLDAQKSFSQRGMASYYADKFEGRITASGEIFQQSKLTAAHHDLPFGTFVKITNLENGNSVVVVINDRGPYIGNRIIDISKKAAIKLDFIDKDLTEVRLEVLEQGNTTEAITIKTENKNDTKKEDEFYKLQSSKYKPVGYGIQIASYTEIANLMRIADNINTSINNVLTIQVVNNQNSATYSLIIGNFKSKQEAEKYKATLQKEFPGCFVIGF